MQEDMHVSGITSLQTGRRKKHSLTYTALKSKFQFSQLTQTCWCTLILQQKCVSALQKRTDSVGLKINTKALSLPSFSCFEEIFNTTSPGYVASYLEINIILNYCSDRLIFLMSMIFHFHEPDALREAMSHLYFREQGSSSNHQYIPHIVK